MTLTTDADEVKFPGEPKTPTSCGDDWLEEGSETVELEPVVAIVVVLVGVEEEEEVVERAFFSVIVLWINSFMMAC